MRCLHGSTLSSAEEAYEDVNGISTQKQAEEAHNEGGGGQARGCLEWEAPPNDIYGVTDNSTAANGDTATRARKAIAPESRASATIATTSNSYHTYSYE